MTLTDQWIEWLSDERGRTANTVATYRRTIRTLPVSPEQMTREQIHEWWKSRGRDATGNPRPHSSRNNELSAVKSFYKWAQRFEHRIDDPTSHLDPLKDQHREHRFVPQDDLKRMLTEFPPDLRRAVALGAYGGLRVSEAASLHWSGINRESRRMTVRGKGDKERQVGFGIVLLDLLLPDTHGNVVTGGKDAYTGHYLQMKVNAAMRELGVQETFHGLRHRYGFMSAASGVPTTSIAKAMGHASLSTTMRYIEPQNSDLDVIAEAVTR